MQDNITRLITEHDNEQITLDQLKEIAKQMFDDTQYGETKNARVMLFSMMYAPHVSKESSYKVEIANFYDSDRKDKNKDSTLSAEINKGMNLGMELRRQCLRKSFLLPSNENDFRLIDCFSKRNRVDWRQKSFGNIKKFKKGDIVYIYSSQPNQRILFQTIIEIRDVPEGEYLDDSEFGGTKEETNKTTRLLLLKKLDKDNNGLSSEVLGKLGIKITQGMQEIRGEALKYIEDFFAEVKFANLPIQRIYFGTPGGGKSYRVKQFIEARGATERCFRTTFHPDTDYASFVGSYKPVMDGKEITYQFIPQIFTNAYVAAWNDPQNDYYLVIEEINRGNCAQIFGDLFQLLDRNADGFSEYGIVADADLRKYLETAVDEDGNHILINKQGVHKGELRLPPNLSILATMNTSDQSLFPMDSAFKRRWAWEFVPSTYKEEDNYELTFGDKTYKWHDFLDAVNPRIKEATDSEDKQLGAYFIKSDMDAEEFKSKVMYYLWSEICKEEYKTRNNFFRHKVGDKPDVEFTFNELYTDGPEDATLLNEFMEYILKKD